MDCTTCREHLLSYLYDELDPELRGQVEASLKTCAECREELEQMREVHHAFDNSFVEEFPERLHQDILRQARVEAAPMEESAPWWAAFVAPGVALAAVALVAGGIVLSSQSPQSEDGASDPAVAQVDAPMPDEEPALGLQGDGDPEQPTPVSTEEAEATEREHNADDGPNDLAPEAPMLARDNASQRAEAIEDLAHHSRMGQAALADELTGRIATNAAEFDARAQGQAAAYAEDEPGRLDETATDIPSAREEQARPGGMLDSDDDDAYLEGVVAQGATTGGGYAGTTSSSSTGSDRSNSARPRSTSGRGRVDDFDDALAAAEPTREPAPIPEPVVTPSAPSTTASSVPQEPAAAVATTATEEASPAELEEEAPEGEAIGALSMELVWEAANASYAAASYDSALASFRSFVAGAAPNDTRVADARFYIGASLYRLGLRGDAESALRDFIARHPGHAREADARFILEEIESQEQMLEAPANRALQPTMDSLEESYRK